MTSTKVIRLYEYSLMNYKTCVMNKNLCEIKIMQNSEFTEYVHHTSKRNQDNMSMSPCNVYPLISHFYIYKKNLPRPGSSNMYPQSMC